MSLAETKKVCCRTAYTSLALTVTSPREVRLLGEILCSDRKVLVVVHSRATNDQFLFYQDAYLREASGYVEDYGQDEKGRNYLVVSPTIFHPHGGGQKGDRGQLFFADDAQARELGVEEGVEILDARYSGGGVRHVLIDSLALGPKLCHADGAKVRLVINWNFRQSQMRLHSSAHVLHLFIEQVLGRAVEFPRTSDLLEDYGLNRYEIPNLLDQDQFAMVLEKSNVFVAEDHPIETGYDDSPGASPGARLWKCGGWTIPCGGTHPVSTAFIGCISGQLSTRRGRTSITFSASYISA